VLFVDPALRHHLAVDLPQSNLPLDRIEVVQRIAAAFPFEPRRPRAIGVEVGLDGEPEITREGLRVAADEQVMIGLLHDLVGDQRRGPHPFEAGHAPGAALRAVHAAGVELDHAVGVRQAAVADAGIERIELYDVDAGDQRLEHVGATRHHGEGGLHARPGAAVLVDVTVVRGDDDRLHPPARHRRRLRRRGRLLLSGGRLGCADEPCRRSREHELAPVEAARRGRTGVVSHGFPSRLQASGFRLQA
jgi:hypothetical protein